VNLLGDSVGQRIKPENQDISKRLTHTGADDTEKKAGA
jgi:hypothetical protein